MKKIWVFISSSPSPHCFLIVAKQSLLIVAKQSSEKPFTSNPEKDIICSGDVCMDISKEKPLMGFERIEYVPTDSTMPIATNVSFFWVLKENGNV